jgi:hypothetical protein
MKKPTVAGGTSTCYLKMKALGGLYGTTGIFGRFTVLMAR